MWKMKSQLSVSPDAADSTSAKGRVTRLAPGGTARASRKLASAYPVSVIRKNETVSFGRSSPCGNHSGKPASWVEIWVIGRKWAFLDGWRSRPAYHGSAYLACKW